MPFVLEKPTYGLTTEWMYLWPNPIACDRPPMPLPFPTPSTSLSPQFQCFSNFNVCINPFWTLFVKRSIFHWVGLGLIWRLCISDKHLGDAQADRLQTILGVARPILFLQLMVERMKVVWKKRELNFFSHFLSIVHSKTSVRFLCKQLETVFNWDSWSWLEKHKIYPCIQLPGSF